VRSIEHGNPMHSDTPALFVEHGVSPVFHVSDQNRPFDDAWYTDAGPTFVPTVEGLSELDSVVVVGAGPPPPPVSVTASMKVVLSAETVPAKAIVCTPLAAIENATLKAAKPVLLGEIKLPTWAPTTTARALESTRAVAAAKNTPSLPVPGSVA